MIQGLNQKSTERQKILEKNISLFGILFHTLFFLTFFFFLLFYFKCIYKLSCFSYICFFLSRDVSRNSFRLLQTLSINILRITYQFMIVHSSCRLILFISSFNRRIFFIFGNNKKKIIIGCELYCFAVLLLRA